MSPLPPLLRLLCADLWIHKCSGEQVSRPVPIEVANVIVRWRISLVHPLAPALTGWGGTCLLGPGTWLGWLGCYLLGGYHVSDRGRVGKAKQRKRRRIQEGLWKGVGSSTRRQGRTSSYDLVNMGWIPPFTWAGPPSPFRRLDPMRKSWTSHNPRGHIYPRAHIYPWALIYPIGYLSPFYFIGNPPKEGTIVSIRREGGRASIGRRDHNLHREGWGGNPLGKVAPPWDGGFTPWFTLFGLPDPA